jgi:hypothetical protein
MTSRRLQRRSGYRASLLAGILVMIALTAPIGAQSTRDRLLGAWHLVKYETFAADGSARPGPYDAGMVVYEPSGQMTAHLLRKDRPTTAPATDADRSAAYQSYIGYFGPFTVDEKEGTVVHHVAGSSYPHWLGTDQVRYYVLAPDGKRLTLSTKMNGRINQTLTWERR